MCIESLKKFFLRCQQFPKFFILVSLLFRKNSYLKNGNYAFLQMIQITDARHCWVKIYQFYDLQGDSLEICLSFSLRKLKALTPCNVSICCRWTPLMVARSWHRTGLEDILSTQPEGRLEVLPSPYLALPLMSIVKIAR